jgi:hypothetical protein
VSCEGSTHKPMWVAACSSAGGSSGQTLTGAVLRAPREHGSGLGSKLLVPAPVTFANPSEQTLNPILRVPKLVSQETLLPLPQRTLSSPSYSC